ncbi:MAG: riboflavin biosynthesis protein RibF [Bacteroidales bacterium]|jgi:riboflavin kinase/FMN adenylyltransferase|nr:riboflavin biosynthesis protein RibF [Bacteroidales bacterium]MDD2264195.1 riboflavin biosynthesis protein RibF [Bacteroidales bacterium]MDD2831333.1 riboflavin biosynthesis protein RibF [Bacteroidales bacterium]MDD3208328.1 riboflavin biosynthesis protein RibF [Bacteroidales bacterium]MDD3696989.1 riboflavin biosynthesis protein RibF [Bacteroidales bacterium]
MVIAATGFFDGVHLGHRAVLNSLVETARKMGGRSLVLSFWPHPRAVLQKDAQRFRLLTSLDEKREMIRALGVDDFQIIPFTRDFSTITSGVFFREYLRTRFGVKVLIAGYNHRLGCDGVHDPERMDQEARMTGLEIIRVPEFVSGQGEHISSTKIRGALSSGFVETANRWLGYPYCLHGVVVEGNRIGRTLGFPTANMQLYEPIKQLPANGVYKVEAKVNGTWRKGMMNIGFRPTVAHNLEHTIETHIFDFDDNIYGLDIKVRILKHHRQEIAFPSLDALKEQLKKDKKELL